MFFPPTGNKQIDAAFDAAFADAFAGRDADAFRKVIRAACDIVVPPEREAAKRQLIADMRAELANLEATN
jgi:hypothetical protein